MEQTGKEDLPEQLAANAQGKDQRLQQMLAYIRTEGCRRAFLLQYFGEELTTIPPRCCDFHGASLVAPADSEQEKALFPPTSPLTWQEIMLKLF